MHVLEPSLCMVTHKGNLQGLTFKGPRRLAEKVITVTKYHLDMAAICLLAWQ